MSLRERAGGGRALALLLALIALAIGLRDHGFLTSDGSFTENDWFNLHRPDLVQLRRAWSEGALVPQWSPWLLGGTPLYEVPTKPFSYPPFLLAAFLFEPDLAMNLLLLAHTALGALGTALLARRLGQSLVGAAAGALLFVLARAPAEAFVATPFSFGHAIAWWPWFLIAWTDLLEGPARVRAALWLALFAALELHAGGEPALYWMAVFAAAYALPWLVSERRALPGIAAATLLSGVVFVGLGAVKLLPELAWLETSGRGAPLDVQYLRDSALEERHAALGHGSRLWTLALLCRDYARGGGLWTMAVGLVLGALFARPRRAWTALLLGSAAAFVLASGALHELAYDVLPGYDRMRRHTRFVHAGFFGLALLAGAGLCARAWLGAGRRAWILGLLALAALLFDTRALPGVNLAAPRLRSASARLAATRPFYGEVALAADGARLHHEENREQSVWLALGLEATSGALGGPAARHPRLIELLPDFAGADALERDARGALDVLAVRHVASYATLEHAHLAPAPLPETEWNAAVARLEGTRLRPFRLWRRSSARARVSALEAPSLVVGSAAQRWAWISRRLRAPDHDAAREAWLEADAEAALALSRAAAQEFAAVLFLDARPEDPVPAAWAREVGGELAAHPAGLLWRGARPPRTRVRPAGALATRRSMHSVAFDVADSGVRALLLADLYALHPGWTAEVDGRRTQLEPCDGLATLVRVPPGARRVELRYRAPRLVAGAWISLATFVLVAFALARRPRDSTAPGARASMGA